MIEFVRGSLAAVGRTTLAHPEHELRVTLYPVYHIGSRAFYEALSRDLERFSVLLLEGVRWKGGRGPLYDLAARNLGLVEQSAALRLPMAAERIPLDMSADEFSREVTALPLRWRLFLRFLRPIFWVLTATEAQRRFVWDVYSKRNYVRDLRHDDATPLDRLIRSKRDQSMAECLRRFVTDRSRTERGGLAAVIAGAAHMPALNAVLRDCGFEKRGVRWFEVLDGVHVPPRPDPRAY